MPDVLLREVDHREVEVIDIVLSRLAVGIVTAKCEGDGSTVRDGYRLASAWLDQRLRYSRERVPA